jgi:hypothetical protein
VARSSKGNNIPRSIVILGVKIKVRVKAKLLHDDGTECLGLYYQDIQEIHLLRDQENISSIFLHEIIHAILEITGANEGLTISKEENIVAAITSGLGNYFT